MLPATAKSPLQLLRYEDPLNTTDANLTYHGIRSSGHVVRQLSSYARQEHEPRQRSQARTPPRDELHKPKVALQLDAGRKAGLTEYAL